MKLKIFSDQHYIPQNFEIITPLLVPFWQKASNVHPLYFNYAQIGHSCFELSSSVVQNPFRIRSSKNSNNASDHCQKGTGIKRYFGGVPARRCTSKSKKSQLGCINSINTRLKDSGKITYD